VTHEFNNLLASLALSAEVALDEGHKQGVRELAEFVLRSATQGSEICSQLATFARPREPQRSVCYVEDALEAAIGVVRNQLARSGVSLQRSYESDGATVEIDPGQMQQVFVNLFINAIHAMPEGGVLGVTTRRAAAGEGGEGVVVTVSDTGMGIAPELLSRVFEPFFTTKGALGEGGPAGTGLGLSVSQSIVTSHQGRLRARSQLGQGSSFEVILPVRQHPVAGVAEAEAAPVAAVTGQARLLVAEDAEDLRRYIGLVLTAAGYEVRFAATTAEALSELGARAHDLVISDLLMPGGGGREVLRLAQRLATPPPVVIISGRTVDDTEAAVLAEGARAFLRKPFSRAELLGAVARCLGAEGHPPLSL
jgi:two-component system, cell cycle sensor histidine kinase and response regulator CckA